MTGLRKSITDKIHYIPTEEVEKIVWNGDSVEYDTALYELGKNYDEFIVLNPAFSFLTLKEELPITAVVDSCITWKYQDSWVGKYFTKNWINEKQYHEVNLNLICKKNAAFKNIKFNDIAVTDLYNLKYQMVWYLDNKFTEEKIWVYKCYLENIETKGTKYMGSISPIDRSAKTPDVVFISYNEVNAEENWLRVLTKAPNAKRVNGIKGIVNAHKQAAELSSTDMFYVVDGDAYLTDDFNFDFQPDIFNRECVYVWTSQNPINNLTYGYGGVKLLPKDLVLKVNQSTIDMTTNISRKFKIFNQVSNITRFNTDEFNTFRSAFRECAKLSSRIFLQEDYLKNKERLTVWCTEGFDKPYGEWAIKGALAGKKYGEENINNPDSIRLINSLEFIKLKFEELM